MTGGSYGQFCPVAMAAEILCTRWTMIVVRELVTGSTRFNEFRRGLPRMSPALLSKRLKELEALEKVSEKVGSVIVGNGMDGVLDDLVRIRPRNGKEV